MLSSRIFGAGALASPVGWALWQLQSAAGIIQFCALALLTIFAIPLCVLSSSAAEGQPREKNVLVLFSAVQYSLSTLEHIEPAMRARVPGPITFYDAYVEDPQVEEKSYRESVSETLRRRYAKVKLDAVIACNPAALHFAVEYRDKIFPGVPIVFVGVGAGDLEKQKIWPGVTGVASPWGFRETIDLMLRLQPDTNTVAVVAGDTLWDKQFVAVAHSELLNHKDKAGEIDIVGPPNHQLYERVAALPPHTVVLFQAFPQFANQPEFGTWDLVTAISQRLPTYSVFPRLCINGCIGGAYEDAIKEDLWTAEIAARVLLGERPDNIPIAYATDLQVQVDWRALSRWQIPESALPLGSVVLNRPPNFWQLYKRYVLAGIFAILALSLAIFALLWQRAKRRKTQELLRESQNQLKGIVGSAMDALIAIDDKLRIIVFNAAAEKMFGCPVRDAIGSPSDRFVPERFRAAHRQHIQHFGDTGATTQALGGLGALWGLRKNGEEFPIEASISKIEVSGGKLYTVIIRDVTERKQAEEEVSSVSRRLIEAHEEERTWIARELHDDINQRVAMVSIYLDNLKQGLPSSNVQVRHRLDEAKQQIEDLGNDVQALSHRLHSSKLEYLGLSAACRSFCKELSEQHNVKIEICSDNVPPDLSKEISICLFRVLQEALQNAVKYSGVREFQVSLKGTFDQVELSVQDSGHGFDSEKVTNSHGLGLTSMKERLKLVDGQLVIDSKFQQGTTIRASVPLSPRMKSAGAVG